MKTLTFTVAAIAVSALALPVQASATVQDNKARRLVAAIQGKVDYRDSDFVSPLTAASKEALSEFQDCKARFIGIEQSDGRIVEPLSGEMPRGGSIPSSDEIIVGLICDGYPKSAGAGLTVHFEGGKIAAVETHAPVKRRGSRG